MSERNFYLCISSITAKDEAIAYFKEVLSAKDKQIVEIEEKLSEFQQGRQEKDIDFAKQLKTTDEELKKTKEIIFQAKETIVKKKAEMEKIPKEVQLFSGKWLPFKLYIHVKTLNYGSVCEKLETFLSARAILACTYSCVY